MPVRVDHARHQHAAGRVDLHRPVRRRQLLADRGDPLADDQEIGVVLNGVSVVHGEDRRVPEDQRPT